MQIGIDLGATKIESVLLDNDGSELHRSRKDSPKNYNDTILSITSSVSLIEKEFKKKIHRRCMSPWINKPGYWSYTKCL